MSAHPRIVGGLAIAAGLGLVVAPLLDWYSPASGSAPTAVGVEAAGPLWLLPVIGAVLAIGGLTLALLRPRHPAVGGWSAAIAGWAALVALAAVGLCVADPPAAVRLIPGGARPALATSVDVRLEPQGPALAVAAIALCAAAAALAWLTRSTAGAGPTGPAESERR